MGEREMRSNDKKRASDRSSDRRRRADAKNPTPTSKRDPTHTHYAAESRDTGKRGSAGKRKKRFVL